MKRYSIDTIPEMADIGVYKITIEARLPQIIYQGDILTREQIFTLTVVDPCTITPYKEKKLRDMKIKLGF